MSTEDERSTITAILGQCDNPVIVDLGAYHGEDAEWMIRAVAHRNFRAVVVEADDANYKELVAINHYPRGTTLVHAAISDHTGTCDFWACFTEQGFGSGSIREPSGHREKDGISYDFRKKVEQTPCYSLDDLFSGQGLDHIDVLWVDIQGAERDMIAGGKEALKRTHWLFVEAEQTELYSGQALRPELLAMLPGWTLVGAYEQNLLLRNDGYCA